MPTLDQHQSQQSVKMLLLGHSGAGKTGLLATLPPAGYRLIIADFDNGLDVLMDPKVLEPKWRKEVFFETFYDKHSTLGGSLVPQVKSYTDFTKYISKWKIATGDIGGLHDWDSNTTFVIDSLSFLGEACMRQALLLAAHLGQRPTQPDWGTAMDMLESVIEMLYNPAVKCNVIVTAHLSDMDEFGKRLPNVLGRKLAPKLGRYFNNVVLLEKKTSGNASTRVLQTVSALGADLKVSKPSKVSSSFEPDLDKLFTILKGEGVPLPAGPVAA